MADTIAVFLDRDGVCNELIFNPKTKGYESPHEPDDLLVLPSTVLSLKRLVDAGFALFLVSNQPSYAKGKTTLEKIHEIHQRFHEAMIMGNIFFTEYFYCYHHPAGIVDPYSGTCACRKPSPHFIFEAKRKYNIHLARSWMIGDVDTDIQCGSSAGCRTVLVKYPKSAGKRKGDSRPDFEAADLPEAVSIVTREHLKNDKKYLEVVT